MVNNRIFKLIGFFPVALAVSVIFEAISWSQQYTQTFHLYPFVSSSSWLIKHFLIALCLTLLFSLLTNLPRKISAKIFVLLSLGAILALITQWGYQGAWFCEHPCDDVLPFLIPFKFGSSALAGVLVIGASWYLLRKAPIWVMGVVIILSLPIIIFSIWRPIYQKQIVKDFPFYTEGRSTYDISPSRLQSDVYQILTSYVETNKPITQRVSAKGWEATCKKFEKSSLGLQFYGATAATNCYAQGALLYEDFTLCKNLTDTGGSVRVTDSDCRDMLTSMLYLSEEEALPEETTPLFK